MRFLKNKLAVTVIVLSVTFLGIIIFSVKNDSSDNVMKNGVVSGSMKVNTENGTNNVVTNGVNKVLNPVQEFFYGIVDKINSTIGLVFNFSDVKKENDELKKRNIELENKLIGYEDFKRQNDEFKKILDFQDQKGSYNYVGVNIIGRSGGSFFDGYIIDKGTKVGVKKDMAVISPEGLVGVVTEVSSSSAKIQPIINENRYVAAMVESTRESNAIIKGFKGENNKPLTKLDLLPLDSEIKVGDKILTSGLGQVYPKGIRIGEVTSIEDDKVKRTKSAIVKPYVDFNKLEELFIVIPKNQSNGIKYEE